MTMTTMTTLSMTLVQTRFPFEQASFAFGQARPFHPLLSLRLMSVKIVQYIDYNASLSDHMLFKLGNTISCKCRRTRRGIPLQRAETQTVHGWVRVLCPRFTSQSRPVALQNKVYNRIPINMVVFEHKPGIKAHFLFYNHLPIVVLLLVFQFCGLAGCWSFDDSAPPSISTSPFKTWTSSMTGGISQSLVIRRSS